MRELQKIKVAVLMGGESAEREVSLHTGEQVLTSLDPARYEAFAVDAAGLKDLCETGAKAGAKFAEEMDGEAACTGGSGLPMLWKSRPDVVFIALHGPGGEDGTIQGFLEVLGLCYTGSGVLASALAMDKARCKSVLREAGIPCPWSLTVMEETLDTVPADLPLPVVVKPNRQGSSFGMTIVHEAAQIPEALQLALRYDKECLVEEFVTGTEITVSALGNGCPEILPAIEIVPKGEFYDYASKYEVGGSRHIIPARISAAAAEKAVDYARRCHQVLGCRGMSRTDMIVRDDNVTVLEINTIPGMTRTSLLPDAAAAAGIPFSALLDRLIKEALDES